METYLASTAPLIDYYTERGLLVSVNADGSPEVIVERAVNTLKLLN
jgi:adenylate kinase family enzyme